MFRADKGYWRTLDGQVIPIPDLGLDHLRKCIELIEKNLQADHYEHPMVTVDTPEAFQKLKELKKELRRRRTN